MAENQRKEIHLRVEKGEAFLPELNLWLDPHGKRDFAFVSHAHADHFASHGKILCSAPTRQLIESRFGPEETKFVSPNFGEIISLEEGFLVEMIPAGHIAGSAMLRIERASDGASLLHTGDFKTRPALSAERIEIRAADTLIMETTFGIPKFRLPPTEEVLASMTKFARETIEEDEVPIFLAYSLGKAQEILLALSKQAPELKFQVHSSVARMNEAVAGLGYSLPDCELFDPKGKVPRGRVLVLPPATGRSRAVRRMGEQTRIAMVSGWGMDSGAKYRYRCDEVFPLSDHAGYDDLLEFVEQVSPQRVFTIHGYREEFARDLRSRGTEAWPLEGETQLEFSIPGDQAGVSPASNPVDSGEQAPPESAFGQFTAICAEIAEVTGKLRKQEILAKYLQSLDEDDLPVVVTFLSGKAFPRTSEVRAANVGWAVVRQSLLDVTGMTLAQYRQVSSSQADAKRTAHLVLQGKTKAGPHSIAEVAALFADLAATRGQGEKVRLLRDAISGFHHAEAAMVVAVLIGDLRIGLQEGLLEESIASAFGRPPSAVRSAHMLTGDLGGTALLAREDRLEEAEATWFTPLKVMLASPESSAEDILARLQVDGGPIWLEDKYDGIRAQLHRKGDRVELYSRDLRPLQEEFVELLEPARQLDHDVILDGEIIAYEDGKKLTFFDLQKRLGRKKGQGHAQGDLFLGEAVPVQFVAFDLLGVDGEGWLDRPLSERRRMLEKVDLSGPITRCDVHHAATVEELEELFKEARRRENEGLIAKDPTSLYSPGRRGKQWLKLKKAMPTLDVVVVKAQQGHGKRSHVLSDYTFSVRDEDTGTLRVLGKAYSGLTDVEIEELTEHFQEKTIEKARGVHTVEPDTVLEVAFDSIQPSKRHDSGLALRFPRIKAIRRDKTPDEIDTLSYARKLAARKG